MINNLTKCYSLLNFESDDDYYKIFIIKRRKENPEMEKGSTNIITYYIDSKKSFIELKDQIISIAEAFNARVYFKVNKRSKEKSAYEALQYSIKQIEYKNYFKVKDSYRKSDNHSNEKNKRWIIDIDEKNISLVNEIINYIKILLPEGNQIIDVLDTINGYHIITNGFNENEFNYKNIEIKKDDMTLMYYKQS